MSFRIDYHFHPNLPSNEEKAKEQCSEFWKKFKEKKIGCVIVTEHAYKNPERAYKLMKETKPEEIYLFPGIECITRDGVDLIVFSKEESIYKYRELTSFSLSYIDLVHFLHNHSELHGFVTHPYTLGQTSVVKKLGESAYLHSLNKLGAVEISNSSFNNVKPLLQKRGIRSFAHKKVNQINKVENLKHSLPPKDIKFLAAGSDAHHVEEVGNCYEVDDTASTIDEAFKLVSYNRGRGRVIFENRERTSFSLLYKTGVTTFGEFLIKQKLRISTRKSRKSLSLKSQ